MPDSLEVLNGSGHLTLTWDPDDPAEVAKAREMVERLRSEGYVFFVVEDAVGSDTVSRGAGRIIVDRINDPTRPPVPSAPPPSAAPAPEREEAPPAGAPLPETSKRKGKKHVALRRMVGG